MCNPYIGWCEYGRKRLKKYIYIYITLRHNYIYILIYLLVYVSRMDDGARKQTHISGAEETAT